MPDRPSWIHRGPEILALIDKSSLPIFDRAAVELLFGLSARQANRLLRLCGGFTVGRSVAIPRSELAAFVRKYLRSGAPEQELARRQKLLDTLSEARHLHRGPRLVIPERSNPSAQTCDNLPAGVSLHPGQLNVEFTSAVDLLEKLFVLAQALDNDPSWANSFD